MRKVFLWYYLIDNQIRFFFLPLIKITSGLFPSPTPHHNPHPSRLTPLAPPWSTPRAEAIIVASYSRPVSGFPLKRLSSSWPPSPPPSTPPSLLPGAKREASISDTQAHTHSLPSAPHLPSAICHCDVEALRHCAVVYPPVCLQGGASISYIGSLIKHSPCTPTTVSGQKLRSSSCSRRKLALQRLHTLATFEPQ